MLIRKSLAPTRIRMLDIRISPREREILALIAAGMPTKSVASRLGLSARTVGTHLERLFERHHWHSRAEAVAAWMSYELAQAGRIQNILT